MAELLTMDVFKQDAFSAVNMTMAIDKRGYVPTLLGEIADLFVPPPLGQPRSKIIFVEERHDEPAIIHTSPRGSEPTPGRTDELTRKVRPFEVPRLARKRRLTATEIAGIRAYGQITELQSLELMTQNFQRLMQRDFSLTWENMRLGAVQGATLDADGTTIYNWSTEMQQTLPGEVTWTLSPSTADGSIRTQCSTTRRGILRALKGLGGNNVRIYGLCSDEWWDALMASQEVRTTWQWSIQATKLQEDVAWQRFDYGGVTFINYRGTDDTSTVAVPSKKVKFFPAGAGIFQEVFAPADERFEFIGSPGQEAYSWIVTDILRNMWADVEMYSYPLMMCTMPQALFHGKIN